MEYQTKISQKLSYKKILTKAENKIYNKNQSILIKKKKTKKNHHVHQTTTCIE